MQNQLAVGTNGERLVLDVSGAAFWPAQETLIFADLHFEKGSSLARYGALLPPYDTRSTLKRIAAVMARHAPARVIGPRHLIVTLARSLFPKRRRVR